MTPPITPDYGPWTAPLYHNGQWIFGAAAMVVRIAQAGGMQTIINTIAQNAANAAIQQYYQDVFNASPYFIIPATSQPASNHLS